jgi:hypothetical protein
MVCAWLVASGNRSTLGDNPLFRNRRVDLVPVVMTVLAWESRGQVLTFYFLSGKKTQELTVISRTDPTTGARAFQQGDRVLLLGAIVREPTLNISGYQGREPMVIWSGLWVAVTPSGS